MDWDKFSFEFELDWNDLFPILVDIEAYRKSVLSLVLPPDWREKLNRLNRVRAIYGTTALEGNPLSESEVSHQIDVAEEGNQANARATREQLQIRNAAIAQEWVKQRFAPNSGPLTVEDVLKMHYMVTQGSDVKDNEPGRLRTFPVKVGSEDMGGIHRGAPHECLPRMMDEFVGFVNSRKLESHHPVIRALLAHFFLVTIHPFGDGNGRVSRLLEAGVLFRGDYNLYGFYGLSNYFYRNEREYKTLLQTCRATQPFKVDEFIRFGVVGFSQELSGINNFIKIKLNRVVYRQMMQRAFSIRWGPRRKLMNQREWSLLDFLLGVTEPTDPFSDSPSRRVSLSELRESSYIRGAYGKVKPRTLFRELARLSALGFINLTRDEILNDGIVEVNFDAIGKY